MAETPDPYSTVPVTDARGTSGWVGWVAFAGVIMFMLGIFHVVEGIVALAKNEYFLVGRNGLVVNIDYTAWGWTHIIAGIIVMLAGVGVLAGQVWARVVGVVVAMLSMV